jgi:hypothetical protein
MINFPGLSLPPNPFLAIIAITYFIIWLCVLYNALKRTDFDPISKFMWVFVICTVPLFGMVFYWMLATPPNNRKEITQRDLENWKNQ